MERGGGHIASPCSSSSFSREARGHMRHQLTICLFIYFLGGIAEAKMTTWPQALHEDAVHEEVWTKSK